MLEADVNTTTLSPFDCSQIYIFPAVSIFFLAVEVNSSIDYSI